MHIGGNGQVEHRPASVSFCLQPFALSLGSFYLDPQKQDTFTLVVSVKDMAGLTENAFKNSVDVKITVKESLWKAPPTITIKENSTQPHPVNISQVRPLASVPTRLLSTAGLFYPSSLSSVINSPGLWHFQVIFHMISFGNDLQHRAH